MNLKRSLLVMNIMLALVNSTYAGEQASFQLDEYVVTATRSTLTQKEVPQSVEVITGETIKKFGSTSVRDVLKYASNFYLADGTGSHGDNFSLRGSGTDDVLILLNGRRIPGENFYAIGRDSTNARVLDRFNLSNVERIELVRGQAGAYP